MRLICYAGVNKGSPRLPHFFRDLHKFDGMGSRAREIATWGENAYLKIAVDNAKGEL